MRFLMAMSVLLATLVPGPCAADEAADIEVARARLRHERAAPRWHPVLSLDINCDGTTDRIFTGRENGRFHVAAVLGPIAPTSAVSIRTFLMSGSSQDSFCGPPTLLEKESLDYDPTEMLGAVPEGFRQSRQCNGLRLEAGECDSFHLFWNHTSNVLDWWRL